MGGFFPTLDGAHSDTSTSSSSFSSKITLESKSVRTLTLKDIYEYDNMHDSNFKTLGCVLSIQVMPTSSNFIIEDSTNFSTLKVYDQTKVTAITYIHSYRF